MGVEIYTSKGRDVEVPKVLSQGVGDGEEVSFFQLTRGPGEAPSAGFGMEP